MPNTTANDAMADQISNLYDDALTEQLLQHYHAIINGVGEDAHREGLLKTPERAVAAAWRGP
jgi:GTP cyclohydrolase I